MIATANADGSVQIWDALTGEVLHSLQDHAVSAEIVSWSSDGRRIATVDLDGMIRIWDVTVGRLIETIESSIGPVVDLSWSPVSDQLAYIGRDTGRQGGLPQIITPLSEIPTSSQKQIHSVAWSPDGVLLAVGYGTSRCVPNRPDLYTIQIINVANDEIINTLPGGDCSVVALDWSPDSGKLASASLDGIGIRIWDTSNGQLLMTKQTIFQGSGDVSWSPDGTQLAITDYFSDTVMILDASTGEILRSIPTYGTVVDWSPDGSRLVSGSASQNEVYISDAESGQELLTLSGHTEPVRAVDWSPDGARDSGAAPDPRPMPGVDCQ
jgi:WD40 repeat protein